MTTFLYGASDDLIELDGDFYDEYDGQSVADVVFGIGSHQMRASIEYTGDWNIKVYGDDEGTEFGYVLHPAGSDRAVELSTRDYTDVLEVIDPVDFVVAGRVMERKK